MSDVTVVFVRHVRPSPFPRRIDSRTYIIDEVCRCGAFRSDHADALVYGKAGCPTTGCREFRWENHVVETGDLT